MSDQNHQSNLSNLGKPYETLLEKVKGQVQASRVRAARAACYEQINLYWWVGQQIVESQDKYGWGNAVVDRLANDLQQFFEGATYGFSKRNLWDMRRFYLAYKDIPNLRQLVAEIPWGQHLVILSKIKDNHARHYYLTLTRDRGLTRNQLIDQIKSQAYERQQITSKDHNFERTLPKSLAEQAQQTLKDVYMLDTLGLTSPVLESQIEQTMVEKIKVVMMELGYGFSFIGNQYRIDIPNGREVYIDLLFFNRRLKALVAVELKMGKFEPEYAGKMNYYLNALDEHVKEEWENPSIGIILCSEKNHLDVEYALRGLDKPVGVSEYQLTKQLPKELSGKLPDAEYLEKEILLELGAGQSEK